MVNFSNNRYALAYEHFVYNQFNIQPRGLNDLPTSYIVHTHACNTIFTNTHKKTHSQLTVQVSVVLLRKVCCTLAFFDR